MQHLTFAAARLLAQCEHWPMVFEQSAIFVIPPRDSLPTAARKAG